MKKGQVSFVCQECGYDSPSWMGKCPECGSWNSLKEFKSQNSKIQISKGSGLEFSKPQKLSEIAYSENSRIQTKYNELNTVLGGGIVRGAVMLLAGDPGVGKSTLLLQLALSLAGSSYSKQGFSNGARESNNDFLSNARALSESRQSSNLKVVDKSRLTFNSSEGRLESKGDLVKAKKILYVSGEESVEQVKMRAVRIVSSIGEVGEKSGKVREDLDNLFLLSATDADRIVEEIESLKPDLVIVDSIQTIESQNVSGLAGSVVQVRYAALQFVHCAKQKGIPIFIVGHVTKEGMVAGPMILSHMVDAVLFLEGERFTTTRILRSFKNRFGPIDEVGVFLMEGDGLTEAINPEQLFLTAKGEGESGVSPGSALVVTLEGSRSFVVEVQALVVKSNLPMPRRVVSGCDARRVELLLAVLQKHCRLPIETMDVFVNVAGGLKLSDRSADLGICLAVFSSLYDITLDRIVAISEVGLLGELRIISGLDKRVKEAKKLGYSRIVTAKTNKSLREIIDLFSMSRKGFKKASSS